MQTYLEIFKSHDSDGSGTMSSHEMRAALAEASGKQSSWTGLPGMRVSPGGSSSCVSGFQLNSTVIQEIVARYTERSYAIDFDRFIGCLICLEMLFRMFRTLDPAGPAAVAVPHHQLTAATPGACWENDLGSTVFGKLKASYPKQR
ncbi:calpain-1 catalytic subunit-like [Maylandia zebra]|uniref:calpain-1 catalytic subunit-like n=1 Tax=Maylandia zebra TaxID=106582 RepID=UPI00403C4090